MSRPLDNAAPTIFAAQNAHRAEGVWGEAYGAYDSESGSGSGSGEEGEEIDAQEVFGESSGESAGFGERGAGRPDG